MSKTKWTTLHVKHATRNRLRKVQLIAQACWGAEADYDYLVNKGIEYIIDELKQANMPMGVLTT